MNLVRYLWGASPLQRPKKKELWVAAGVVTGFTRVAGVQVTMLIQGCPMQLAGETHNPQNPIILTVVRHLRKAHGLRIEFQMSGGPICPTKTLMHTLGEPQGPHGSNDVWG